MHIFTFSKMSTILCWYSKACLSFLKSSNVCRGYSTRHGSGTNNQSTNPPIRQSTNQSIASSVNRSTNQSSLLWHSLMSQIRGCIVCIEWCVYLCVCVCVCVCVSQTGLTNARTLRNSLVSKCRSVLMKGYTSSSWHDSTECSRIRNSNT